MMDDGRLTTDDRLMTNDGLRAIGYFLLTIFHSMKPWHNRTLPTTHLPINTAVSSNLVL
jgi:hypothetical protein